MGMLRAGLRSWWQGLQESSLNTVKRFHGNVLKPPFTHSFMITKSEDGLNILLGRVFGVLFAGTIAAQCRILVEFLVGLIVGGGLMAVWAKMAEKRSRKLSAIARNVALVGVIPTAIAGSIHIHFWTY
jgi:hypothetical protein